MSPARPVPASPGRSKRREFGSTWWGGEWIEALETRAQLDPNRLPRGRSYARHNRVDDLVVRNGEVGARVWGTRRTPYVVRVRIRTFTDAEWERVVVAIVTRAAHAAALLDGELSPEIADDVRSAGLDLLPGPGEIGFTCSCPDGASPCKHSAAVCYLTANALDADPFAVLLLRGRDRETIVAGLRRHRAGPGDRAVASHRADDTDAGVEARAAAFAGPAGALPPTPPPPREPGRPARLVIDPPEGSGITTTALAALAADTAQRARLLATGLAGSGVGLDERGDLARRAAGALDDGTIGALARQSSVPGRALVRLAGAWSNGGAAGVEVLEDRWDPGPEELESGRSALVAGLEPGRRHRVSGNALTAGDVQLRLGRDRRWYRFDRRGRDWELLTPPADDPADLLGPEDAPPSSAASE